jgi:hypothetical protein
VSRRNSQFVRNVRPSGPHVVQGPLHVGMRRQARSSIGHTRFDLQRGIAVTDAEERSWPILTRLNHPSLLRWAGVGQTILRPGYGLDDRGSVLDRGNDGISSLRHCSGVTQLSIQWLPETRTQGVKRLGHEADHPPPCSAEVKNPWSYTSSPQYVFMAWCLVLSLLCITLAFWLREYRERPSWTTSPHPKTWTAMLLLRRGSTLATGHDILSRR